MPWILLLLAACAPAASSDPGKDAGTDAGDNGGNGGNGDNGANGGNGGSTGSCADAGTDPCLTVTDGYGSGRYPAGSTAWAFAAVDPQHAIVTGWEPAAAATDAAEWNTGVPMPAADLTLTPTTLPVDLALRDDSAAGRDLLVAAPAAPRGLVMFFHGAAYNRGELRDNAATSVAMRLVHAGWEVVALDSTRAASAGTGGWDDSYDGSGDGSNDDLAAARAVVDALKARGDVAADAPVVSWGMSSGGQFAHAFGRALPAQYVVGSCAPGRSGTAGATTTPTLWLLAEADSTFPSGASDAAAYAATLAAGGHAAEVYVHPRTPLYAERFTRVAGIDADRSAALVAEIAELGVLDADGRFTVPGAQVTAGLDLPSLDGLSAAQVTAVKAEIEIVAAEHELYDDAGARMVAFLER